MSDTSLFAVLRTEVDAYIGPLKEVARSSDPPAALIRLLQVMRWQLPVPEDDIGTLVTAWESVIAIVEALGDLDDAGDLFGAIELIDDVGEAIAGLQQLSSNIEAFAADFQWQVLGPELGTDLLQTLTLIWLTKHHPNLYRIAAAIGIIRLERISELLATPDGPLARYEHTAQRIDPAGLLIFLADPVDALQTVYGVSGIGDSETAEAIGLLAGDRLGALVRSFGGSGFAGALLPPGSGLSRTVGLSIPLPSLHSLRAPPAIDLSFEVLSPSDVGASGQSGPGIDLSLPSLTGQTVKLPGWDLTLDVSGAELPFFVGPDGLGVGGPGPVHLSADLARTRGGPLVIGAGATRLEITPPVLRGWFDLNGTADYGFSLVAPASGLFVSPGETDSFVGALLGWLDIEAVFDFGIEWSRSRGIGLTGGAGYRVYMPTSVRIGPLTITATELDVDIDGSVIELDATIEISCVLGPFSALVSGLGIEATLDFDAQVDPNLGFAQLLLRVQPPYRIEFTITSEAVNGGGFVEYFEETGRYLGGLSLDILTVGIDALVIVDTRLPGDPDGWAFFATLTATFPGIPLGFGFTLEGVGGLVALNRSLDEEALAIGLRSGAVDALLFPENPVDEALELAAQIDEYFPLTPDNTVIGPIIQMGWGSPTLITGQLGIMISMPEGLIAVMGSVTALLPDPDAPLLTINMDSLGVVDMAAGTFSLTASLYDSRLLATIDLGGDMAMFLSATSQPYFLLSVGGFHPGFEPPCVVPASMHDLRAMWASIDIASNISVSVEAYFAVTSNSLQFGSAVNLEATVDVGLATYSARGWFAFDVLLEFSPFRIEASMAAGVGVYSGNKELMGVNLSFMLEGPEPWAAAGDASFKFFGIKVKFSFDVGDGAGSEPRPIAHPQRDACNAMRSASAWSEAEPVEGLAAGLTYTGSGESEEDIVWVRPDHQLRVRQSVAPLERQLEIVGQAVPAAGEEFLEVTGYGFGDTPFDDKEFADDWFAPAQFEDLGSSQRLSRDSFEEMHAGVAFGNSETAVTASGDLANSVVTDYEEGTLENSAGLGAASRGIRQFEQATEPMFVIQPTAYTVARTGDGGEATLLLSDAGAATGGVDQYTALAAHRAWIDAKPSDASQYVVVPAATTHGGIGKF